MIEILTTEVWVQEDTEHSFCQSVLESCVLLKLPKGYFMSKQSKTAWNTFGEIPWPKCQFVTCNSGSRSLFGYLSNRSLLMSFCCCFVCFLFTKVVYHMPESFWWYSGTKIRLVSWHNRGNNLLWEWCYLMSIRLLKPFVEPLKACIVFSRRHWPYLYVVCTQSNLGILLIPNIYAGSFS